MYDTSTLRNVGCISTRFLCTAFPSVTPSWPEAGSQHRCCHSRPSAACSGPPLALPALSNRGQWVGLRTCQAVCHLRAWTMLPLGLASFPPHFCLPSHPFLDTPSPGGPGTLPLSSLRPIAHFPLSQQPPCCFLSFPHACLTPSRTGPRAEAALHPRCLAWGLAQGTLSDCLQHE